MANVGVASEIMANATVASKVISLMYFLAQLRDISSG